VGAALGRLLDIARAARSKAKENKQKLTRAYGKLLTSTSRVLGQAKRISKEIAEGMKRASSIRNQLALEGLRREREQKKRWFRNGQKWRTGCEGRISVVKRRHGLNRCR
jgi:hypothetical protein